MKGAIFDLDGTIADSVGVWKKVDDKVLGRYGIKVDEKYRQAIKMLTYRECVEYIANNFNTGKTADELDKEFTKEAIYEYGHNIKPKRGIKEFLLKMRQKGIKTAILTSSVREMCEAFLKNNGLFELFDDFVYCGEEKMNKNNKQVYIYTAKKLNVQPCMCIAFDDLSGACKSAKEAGMRVIGIEESENIGELHCLKEVCDDIMADFMDAYKIVVRYE